MGRTCFKLQFYDTRELGVELRPNGSYSSKQFNNLKNSTVQSLNLVLIFLEYEG